MSTVPKNPMMITAAWIESHCVIPDMTHQGAPFILRDEQLLFVANHYDVKPTATYNPAAETDLTLPQNPKAAAFTYRRSQLVRSQKWGKSPLVSAFACLEGVGPALFAGWSTGKETYDCAAHGCGCGWFYQYEEGEPMGRPWPTALIQITATTEDQTDNTYDALRPMINLGPLSLLIPKTGEEFIRLPNGGRIDAVTSKGNSRLGQRVTFVIQDETGLWIASNGGHNLAKKQRQGLAGMDGRAIETTNAWNPADDSVAQRTYESSAQDIYRDFKQAPSSLDFGNPKDRRKIFAFNYQDAPWVNIATIEAQAAEMMEKDPTDAERFFGNRIVAGHGTWLKNLAQWDAKALDGLEGRQAPIKVAARTKICLGFDGSDNNDYTAIRAETLDLYQFTPKYLEDRKTMWRPQDYGGRIPRAEVRNAFKAIATEYEIVRAYCDPMFWETEIDELAAEFGSKVFVKWPTNRPAAMFGALERFRTDIYNPDSRFTHDGDPDLRQHLQNAVMRMRSVTRNADGQAVRQYILGKPADADHQKIDYVMSSVLAHEAALDALATGERAKQEPLYIYY
ncbi:hypothetical protein [Canibacter oris]|uniref:Terminase n=1 Tax=Canibacter oris TaxID=1365628 RepID=A0A840DPM7_9MICO|nr:hypothetical protein [Canibacter oris]MBB4072057.1 hypothetical protein [Canibacter oris]